MDIKISADVVYWVATYCGLPGLGCLLLGMTIYHWAKIARFLADIWTIPARLRSSGEEEILRHQLQADINYAISLLDREVPGLFDESLSVRWVREGETHATLRKRSLVLKVKNRSDHDEVVVEAVTRLLERSLLPASRKYIHGHVQKALELVVAERVIASSRFRSALPLFRTSQYDPVVAVDKSVAGAAESAEALDHQGLLTRVFLSECLALSERLGAHHESSGPKWDTTAFLAYLRNLVASLQKEDAPIDFEFDTRSVKCAVAVLADVDVLKARGLPFYRKRTQRSIESGAESVYIIALGTRNVGLSISLAERLRRSGLISDYYGSRYTVSIWGSPQVPAVAIACRANSQIILTPVRPGELEIDNDQVLQVVSAAIPQVASGKIQVVKSAIMPRRIAQIAVYSPDKTVDPIPICIGSSYSRSNAIAQELHVEEVRFVLWSTDIKAFILATLGDHEQREVMDVIVDPSAKIASVQAVSEAALAKLAGRNNVFTTLSQAMTGYDIAMDLDPAAPIREFLTEYIPPIKEDSVQIAGIAVIPGIEARVFLRSDRYSRPAAVCVPHLAATSREKRPQERIWLCNHEDDPEQAIVSALYPLDPEEIARVSISSTGKAEVYLTSQEAYHATIGLEGSHVRAASILTGFWIEVYIADG